MESRNPGRRRGGKRVSARKFVAPTEATEPAAAAEEPFIPEEQMGGKEEVVEEEVEEEVKEETTTEENKIAFLDLELAGSVEVHLPEAFWGDLAGTRFPVKFPDGTIVGDAIISVREGVKELADYLGVKLTRQVSDKKVLGTTGTDGKRPDVSVKTAPGKKAEAGDEEYDLPWDAASPAQEKVLRDLIRDTGIKDPANYLEDFGSAGEAIDVLKTRPKINKKSKGGDGRGKAGGSRSRGSTVLCEGCGDPITGIINPERFRETSEAKYGGVYCFACQKKL